MKSFKLFIVALFMLGSTILSAADSVPHEYDSTWGPHKITISEIRSNAYGIYFYGVDSTGKEYFLALDNGMTHFKETVSLLYTAYSSDANIYATFDKNVAYPNLAIVYNIVMQRK